MEVDSEEDVEVSKASLFDPVGHYNAKEAMQNRYDALKEMCMNYGDFMRPERVITEITPEKEGMYDNSRASTVCTVLHYNHRHTHNLTLYACCCC